MVNFNSYLLALATCAAAAPPESSPYHNTRSPDTINWAPCGDLGLNETVGLSCGSLTVPLDYTEPESGETIDLQIFKIRAPNQPSKGSVFINFGGPGAAGIAEMATAGNLLTMLVGGSYDVIDVVPRGTGTTLPFSCYESTEERSGAMLRATPATNGSNVALSNVWAEAKNTADTCYYAQNATGSFIGTAATARDIMSVVNAIEEDGMLRFWGISYGSILGATLIALFPDKVDRVLLDGVWNAHEYYQIDVHNVASSDDAFSGFCAQCVDNADICPIAGNRTAAELEEDLYAAFEELKYNPIPLSVEGKGVLVDYATIKGIVYYDLYFPAQWPALGHKLDILFSGNVTGIAPDLLVPTSTAPDAEAGIGIKCSDILAHAESLEEVLPDVKARSEMSRFAGDIADISALQCARWRMPAKERYDGDFRVETAHPVLLVNNRNDPITPLVSAKNMSAGFEGSVLIEQEGYGHTMLSQGSLCTAKAVIAYFANGTLPEPGTICGVDAVPFSGDEGWGTVVEGLGLSGDN